MDNQYIAVTVAVIAAVTIALRFLPFWIFGEKQKTPKFILKLSKTLPYAIMGMLIVYCLRNVKVSVFPHGYPELIAGGAVVLLHLWKRNTLLSVGVGTVLYMILVQLVFV